MMTKIVDRLQITSYDSLILINLKQLFANNMHQINYRLYFYRFLWEMGRGYDCKKYTLSYMSQKQNDIKTSSPTSGRHTSEKIAASLY